jgi:citrate synthase
MTKKTRYLTAKEAADALDISLSTLYAYVSRGLIRSEAGLE